MRFAGFTRTAEELAGRRWTVLFFVLMALASLAVAEGWVEATRLVWLPLALLVLNLGASLLVHPRFRADLPLLVFHLALLALVTLFAVARLTYVQAGTTISAGRAFDQRFDWQEIGPLHGDGLSRLRFTNLGFTENFPERGKYLATYNRVAWQDSRGNAREGIIGDDVPLLIDGYRIYTTGHRGFAILLRWTDGTGAAEYGTVELLDRGGQSFAPANDFDLPGGLRAWAMLDLERPGGTVAGQRTNLGVQSLPHRLILRIDGQRLEFASGQSRRVGDGVVTYLGLRPWIAYRIVYDPTRPWMIATVLVAVGALVWFYVRRFAASRPGPVAS